MDNLKSSEVSNNSSSCSSSSIANQSENNFNQVREETFPIDTVKQIYDDIEKLFDSEDSSNDNNNSSNYQSLLMVAKSSIKQQQPQQSMPIINTIISNINTNNANITTNNNNIIINNNINVGRNYNTVVNKSINKHNVEPPAYCKALFAPIPSFGENSGEFRSDSNRFNLLLNEINQCTENNLSLFDYVQLCSFELDCLEAEIEQSNETDGTSSRINCGQTKKWTPKLNELHILLWNLFNLHEKLSTFCSSSSVDHFNQNDYSNISGSYQQQRFNPLRLALIEKIKQTGEIWYGIAEKIKDTITMTRSVDDFLASIRQTKQFQQLWLLTRSIRTLYFLICSSNANNNY